MPVKTRNRYIFIIAALLLSCVPVYLLQYDGFQPTTQGDPSIEAIPINIQKWQGNDVALEQWVYELLETPSIIHRSYLKNDQRVFLSVVHYADTKVGFHAPEACLGAQGLELSKNDSQIPLERAAALGVNELVYQRAQYRELVYYFYKAGNYMGDSYLNLRLNIAYNKLFSGTKSGSLIRVSTPVRDDTMKFARQTLSDFINAIHPFVLSGL